MGIPDRGYRMGILGSIPLSYAGPSIAFMIKEYQRITNVDPAPTRRNSFDFIFGSEDTSDYDSIIVCGIVNSRLFPVSLLLK